MDQSFRKFSKLVQFVTNNYIYKIMKHEKFVMYFISLLNHALRPIQSLHLIQQILFISIFFLL